MMSEATDFKVGDRLRWRHNPAEIGVMVVKSVARDGMLTFEGEWVGEFAPHLFERVSEGGCEVGGGW